MDQSIAPGAASLAADSNRASSDGPAPVRRPASERSNRVNTSFSRYAYEGSDSSEEREESEEDGNSEEMDDFIVKDDGVEASESEEEEAEESDDSEEEAKAPKKRGRK